MYRCTLAFVLIACSSQLFGDQLTLHVSPTGREHATGTELDPYDTIEQARDRIRTMRSNGDLANSSVNVIVHEGRYTQLSTLNFTAEDSGTEDFPVNYRAQGEVVIDGGIELREWRRPTEHELLSVPVIAHEQVLCSDLGKKGIQCDALHSNRLHQPIQACPLELFANQERLPRAGWPNEGWAFAKPTGSTNWKIEHQIHERDQSHVWALGFWDTDWSSSLEPIALNRSLNQFSFASTEPRTPKMIRAGARYRLTNLIGDLDSPGEWYVDVNSGVLYYWPVKNGAVPSASILETVVSIYDSEYFALDGFRIESARSMNVEVAGGCNVCLRNCSIGQAGTVGVHVFGGKEHRIENCEVACTGSSAIRIEAGDREHLVPCNHVVENCRVHDYSHHFLGGRAGIAIYGVGVSLTSNHIHDGPDTAIAIFGNEHTIENNEIANVCKETDDSAAIHLSYDPTYRGNVIRKNYVHDLGGFSQTGIIGIYLDDFASGTVVENNLLVKTIRGIAIGGGRDNRIEGNIVLDAIAPFQLDARGLTWASDEIQGDESRISKLCKSVIERSPVYGERYPELLSLLNNEPALPKGNVFRSNSFDGPRSVDLQGIDRNLVVTENNRRVDGKKLADTETTLRKLGIELLSSKNGTTEKKYVGVFSE